MSNTIFQDTYAQIYNSNDLEEIKSLDSVKTIDFMTFKNSLNNVKLPDSIETIKFDYGYSEPLNNVKWPESLQTIYFFGNFNQPIDNVKWPKSLQEIRFGYDFNHSIEFLPEGLKVLKIWGNLNKKKNIIKSLECLPSSLETLYIEKKYIDLIPEILRDKVKYL